MPKRVRAPSLSPARDPGDYIFFSGGVSRWIWRVYTQRITPAGRWFALASGVFVMYGGVSLQLQGYVLVAYAAGLWIVALVAMFTYRPRVRLTVQTPLAVSAGQRFEIDLSVQQRSRLRGADLVVVPNRLPPELQCDFEDGLPLPDLRRSTSTAATFHLQADQRGQYTLRGFRIETGFPFGLLRARQTFREQRPLLVYPQFVPLQRLLLDTPRRQLTGEIAMSSRTGDSMEYLGNRDYRPGDNVRDIDWRATARFDRPVVREWIDQHVLRAVLVIDTFAPPARRKRWQPRWRKDTPPEVENFEPACSLTAAAADALLRQDYRIDAIVAGDVLHLLPTNASPMEFILEQLAFAKPVAPLIGVDPFAPLQATLPPVLESVSTAVCILLDWDAPRRELVTHLRERGLAIKVLLCRTTPATVDPLSDPQWGSAIIVVPPSTVLTNPGAL